MPTKIRVFAKVLVLLLLAVSTRAFAGEAQLDIDVAKPGPAISPYLYGQFIEHLGRCIHDGIWAEKLRDRKFLLEPAKSPWKTVKPEGAQFEVFHDPAGAYAGDHCMALWLREPCSAPCGIRQGDIGFIAGKEYVGYVIAACPEGKNTRAELRISNSGDATSDLIIPLRGIKNDYSKIPFRFRATKTTDTGSIALTVTNSSYLWLACLSLMPADNIRGMRADTLELVRVINSPIIRWPGGNFVSGYNWKDGIGDRDRRPPRWERAWNDVEDNDFGIDEFLDFCAEVHTEPYIAVNTGLGSVQSVIEQVEYVTGSPKSRWGAERARDGHPKPYKVEWWGIGNEMFGDWQLGHIPVERYAVRHNAFVAAVKANNPKAKIIGVGAPGRWNDVMLPLTAKNMDLVSGHHYTQRKLLVPFSAEDARSYEQNFALYSGDVAAGIRNIVADLRNRRGRGDRDLDRIRLAIDEWGIVRDWNQAPDGPGVGSFEHYYTLGDTIACARGLHELLRSSDLVEMANWAQTVNVIGAIKTSRNYAVLDPVGHMLALYRKWIGGRLVPTDLHGAVSIDAVASFDEKTGVLSIALINYAANESASVSINPIAQFRSKSAKAWSLNGPHLAATNIPGQPETVATSKPETLQLDRPITLPAHSITIAIVSK